MEQAVETVMEAHHKRGPDGYMGSEMVWDEVLRQLGWEVTDSVKNTAALYHARKILENECPNGMVMYYSLILIQCFGQSSNTWNYD